MSRFLISLVQQSVDPFTILQYAKEEIYNSKEILNNTIQFIAFRLQISLIGRASDKNGCWERTGQANGLFVVSPTFDF